MEEYLEEQDNISIHAPRMGSDWLTGSNSSGGTEFQSTLPVWGATPKVDIREE